MAMTKSKPTLMIGVKSGPASGNFTVPLEDGWRVTYGWCIHNGHLVVTEVRVHSDAPLDGERLTASLLRKIAPGKHVYGMMRKMLARMLARERGPQKRGPRAWLESIGLTPVAAQPGPQGPKGWPLARYARLAASYVEACESDSRSPVANAAKKHRLSRVQMRDALSRARKRGLLTSQKKQGSPGGWLTPKAKKLLKGGRK